MTTVLQTIHRLLPAGTRMPSAPLTPLYPDWSFPPLWPQDLFAVAATLVNRSGCYAHNHVLSTPDFAERARRLGALWRNPDADSKELRERLVHLWDRLLAYGNEQITTLVPEELPGWCEAALELLAISDEAAAGVGFLGGSTALDSLVKERHFSGLSAEGDEAARLDPAEARRLVATLCVLVPAEECCVQPKGRTPQVGCSLRSLSHHLALLPPLGEVTTRYQILPQAAVPRPAFNVLLVPFPYRFPRSPFAFGRQEDVEGWGFFDTQQDWLPPGTSDDRARALSRFLEDLIREAETQSSRSIHAVVLPELALPADVALNVSKRLAGATSIDLFVAGMLRGVPGGAPRNTVLTRLYRDRQLSLEWEQNKHHRWRVDDGQLAAYGATPPVARLFWWENIDVANREVIFGQLTPGAAFATMICEDLARIEPVHSVVRAVGPSLLFALLMDGPQLPHRWSTRAAMSLVDDPGISVLTLTSAAAVIASNRHHKTTDLAIGAWHEPGKASEPISMAEGDHGVVVPLTFAGEAERTLDRRGDQGSAEVVRRQGNPVNVRLPHPPPWL